MIREVIHLVGGEASARGISITLQLQDDLPYMCGDRVQLQQVLLNLVLNAFEAIAEARDRRREVVVRTMCELSEVITVAVEDSGIGLEDDALQHIFDPFFSTKARRHGHGVGDQSLHYHDASWAHLGHVLSGPRCNGVVQHLNGLQGDRMNEPESIVLVVDDDDSFRRGLERLLHSVSLGVETFSSAQEFMRHPPPDGPACLVLDMRMPGMSGLEVQQGLVAAGHSLPIIFLTGHATVPMSVRALKTGAIDFLQKPVEDQLLLDTIHQALEQDRQAKAQRPNTAEAATAGRHLDTARA